jgi:hypothetical protein
VSFTPGARPGTGVLVKLDCLDEAPHLASVRADVAPGVQQPTIGDACDTAPHRARSGDAACAITLAGGGQDTGMFCHPVWNVCVQGCANDADCPPAWVCDAREETTNASGRAMCINPTCGDAR